MKRTVFLALSLCCFLISGLCLFSIKRADDEALASRIAPEILRLHVLANSDNHADQQLKIEVKSVLVDRISRDMTSCSSKEEMCAYLTDNRDELESLAESYIQTKGYSYPVSLKLTKDYFPAKTYGDMSFPCGTYDAARFVIGKGKGHNWWCVLYPSLCFIDPTYATVPDSSKEKLKSAVDDKDFHALESSKRPAPHIKFKILELFGRS
ncbi:stage II sporulation protein R [Clostridium sp. AM58-1XD]|uniref:stage II sporulation protein R n=1 Tax=Clostridium sp. AM58-1XD TaxID=2292307 RepID=UPI001FA84BA0|nr:stage II sporulation protein R [Clostridium sp. AM58-1XD]